MVTITFAPGESDETTLENSDIVSIDAAKTHTGKGDFRATVAPTSVDRRSLDTFVQRKKRINVEYQNEIQWCGYLTSIDHDFRGETRISAEGIAKRLEETRPDYEFLSNNAVEYSQIALADAINDYWSRTPFDNVTTNPEPTELVAEDELIQRSSVPSGDADIADFTTIEETEPVRIDESENAVDLNQVCFTQDSDNYTHSGTALLTDDDYSGGDTEGIDDFGSEIEISFTLNHTIPGDEFEMWVRFETFSNTSAPGVEFTLENNADYSHTWQPIQDGAIINVLDWRDLATDIFGEAYSGGDIPAGDYTLTLSGTTSDTDQQAIDVLAPTDGRFSGQLNFDNDNGGNGGYLEGPERYPNEFEFEFDVEPTAYNIPASRVESAWNDTSGNQAVALSNDGGATYQSASNTTDLDVTWSSPGRLAQFKVTFSRFGSQTGATPLNGINGQSVALINHYVDLNTLTVIDELELTKDHFSNLQTLHNYGNYQWTIRHSDEPISNIATFSYDRGELTQATPTGFDKQENKSATVEASTYYNSIYIEGAQDENGNRPTATAQDIPNDEREITPGVLRDLTITTEAGAQFRANALLDKAKEKNAVKGQVNTAPTLTDPGFAYAVDFGSGEQDFTLETVRLNFSRSNANATFEFVDRPDLGEDIRNLKQQTSELSNRV